MIRVALLLACLAWPATAQVLGSRTTLDCASFVKGDMVDASIEIICGIPAQEMTEMMRLAVSGRPDDYSKLLSRLDDLTPEDARVKAESIRSFFQILKQDEVPAEQVRDRLAEIARRHIELQDQLAVLQVADPDIQAEIDAAAAALAAEPPDHDKARARLAAAHGLRREKREAAQTLLDDQSREEARIIRRRAELEASVLNRPAAATLYEDAAGLWPAADRDEHRADIFDAASQLYDHGLYQGDNDALRRAIARLHDALMLVDRTDNPLDWAMTQSNLGLALQALGAREPGTARLEEAVTAYRAALQERTRDRVPLDWAATTAALAQASTHLAARTGQPEMARQALAEATEAASSLRQHGHVPWADYADAVVVEIETALTQMEGQ